ncbi:MAG: transcription initiation factor IIB, partial [Candidatus Thorarchaeota archaeon]
MNMKSLASTKTDRRSRKEVCMGCGQSIFTKDYTRGERTCSVCGLVASDRTADTGPEWRAFTSEETNARARVGAPATFTMADKGISTMIDWRNRDASGRAIKSDTRAAMYRMRKWHIRSRLHSSQDRKLNMAMSEMQRLASQLGIPHEVRVTAALIYRKSLITK